jgi:H+/Cl- antiporter ClcA
MIFFVGLFLFALWDGEFVALSITGLGFAIYGYRHEEIEKLEEKVTKRIMRQVDATLMSIMIYGMLVISIIINFFMDEPQISLIDAIYVVLGIVFGLRGLFIRSVYQEEIQDRSKVTAIRKTPSS